MLKYLSQETGGLTFFPFKVQDLAQTFENIANELRHQYSVLYRPEPGENRRPVSPCGHQSEGTGRI